MKVSHSCGNIFKEMGLKNPEKILEAAKAYDKQKEKEKFSKWLGKISLCPHCYCMTYTIKSKCGKCKKTKEENKNESISIKFKL